MATSANVLFPVSEAIRSSYIPNIGTVAISSKLRRFLHGVCKFSHNISMVFLLATLSQEGR